jgi:predicted MPP superfamily phosphohydrolase
MKKALPWLSALALGGLGWLAYGALVESKKLVVVRRKLHLPDWPTDKDGYKVALLADLHIRDEYSIELVQRAIELALAEDPDVVAIAGDFVGYWKQESPWQLEEALKGLDPLRGRIVGVPGNHDYWYEKGSEASDHGAHLVAICAELGIVILRNESIEVDGIAWVGIDSANERYADPGRAGQGIKSPSIAIWHEPDFVDFLPDGVALMLSGHSHGGQWRFPWGWTPMHTKGGSRYVEGFYPEASTPLYVSRGIGTTGPPARLGVLPEVIILELYHG